MIVDCAKHLVVRIGRKYPIFDYVEIVSQRRTDARERKMKNRKLRTAPDVGRSSWETRQNDDSPKREKQCAYDNYGWIHSKLDSASIRIRSLSLSNTSKSKLFSYNMSSSSLSLSLPLWKEGVLPSSSQLDLVIVKRMPMIPCWQFASALVCRDVQKRERKSPHARRFLPRRARDRNPAPTLQ